MVNVHFCKSDSSLKQQLSLRSHVYGTDLFGYMNSLKQ